MRKEDRSTSRSLRIPLEVDSKVMKFQKEIHSSISQAYLVLIQVGLEARDLKIKAEKDPKVVEKIDAMYKEKLEELVKEQYHKEFLSGLTKKQLEYVMMNSHTALNNLELNASKDYDFYYAGQLKEKHEWL